MLTVTDDQGQTASSTTTITPHAKTVPVRLVVHFARNRAALTAAARRILNPARGSIRFADTVTINGYCAAREDDPPDDRAPARPDDLAPVSTIAYARLRNRGRAIHPVAATYRPRPSFLSKPEINQWKWHAAHEIDRLLGARA
jgi:hypothetical protein